MEPRNLELFPIHPNEDIKEGHRTYIVVGYNFHKKSKETRSWLEYRVGKNGKSHYFQLEYFDEFESSTLYPRSEGIFTMVDSWLNTCAESHTQCSVVYDAKFKPTRLLDVGSRGISPKIVETAEYQQIGINYLTLSHCWGSVMPESAKTTTATLSKRLVRIRTRTLPRTFRDAIVFTRRLGIQYLWIDSLCIIQNSPEDWQRESALMGKTYSHCFCMLAAAASDHCNGGLFARRADLPIISSAKNFKGQRTPFVLLRDEYFDWAMLLQKSPLSYRGWTLQERELSPKIVYFTKEELLFECREACGAEMADRRTYFPMKRSKLELVSKAMMDPNIRRCLDPIDLERLEDSHKTNFHSTNDRQYSAWLKLVQGYSSRKLTILSDKFPGLSGLASECSFLLNDQYIAGIWKGDIIRGLCWIASPSTIHSSKAEEVTAYGPSWSWAKMAGPISYEWHHNLDYRSPPLFTTDTREAWYGKESDGASWSDPILLDATTVPEGKDPNGTLFSAELRFSAQIILMRRIKTGNCMIANISVAIKWDFLPQSRTEFFLLSLGGIAIGLALVREEAHERTFRRVGIVPHTRLEWFKDIEFQEITLI